MQISNLLPSFVQHHFDLGIPVRLQRPVSVMPPSETVLILDLSTPRLTSCDVIYSARAALSLSLIIGLPVPLSAVPVTLTDFGDVIT